MIQRHLDPLPEQDATGTIVIEPHIVQVRVIANNGKVQIRRCWIDQGKVSVGPAPLGLLSEELVDGGH